VQDTLDVTGADYDTILNYCTLVILFLYSETTQVYNSGVTDGRTRVETSPLTR